MEMSIGYGRVSFEAKVDPTPKTKSEHGNTTIINEGSPGLPAKFEVSHVITAYHEVDGHPVQNNLFWTNVLTDLPLSTSYSEVESASAEKLPAALRTLADLIEADNKRVASLDKESSQ